MTKTGSAERGRLTGRPPLLAAIALLLVLSACGGALEGGQGGVSALGRKPRPGLTATWSGVWEGATLAGTVAPGPSLVPGSGSTFTGVVFTLADAGGAVRRTQSEGIAPWCLTGDDGSRCHPWDTTALANGSYRLTAVVNGTTSFAVNFAIRNEAAPPPPPPPPPPPVVSNKLVFAHYMSCCPGVSDTVDGYSQDIQMAKAAGIDGFMYNAMQANFAGSFGRMLEAARLNGDFKIALKPDYCCGMTDPNVLDALKLYGSHPNYLKKDGKLFVSSWGGDNRDWRGAIFSPLKSATGYDVYFLPYFIARRTDGSGVAYPSYDEALALFDRYSWVGGIHHWNIFGNWGGTVDYAVKSMYDFTAAGRARNKAVMMGVMPLYVSERSGNNQINGNMKGAIAMQREWRAIIELQPDYVEFQTWNDPNERSYVGPHSGSAFATSGSNALDMPHFAYLELSKYYIQWYKTGLQPQIDRDGLFYFYRTHDKDAVASNPPLPKPADWANQEDKLYLTAMLKEPGTVRLISGGVATDFTLPAGVSDVAVDFREGAQRVELHRNGALVTGSTGAKPISNTITRYSFNYYSNFVYAAP